MRPGVTGIAAAPREDGGVAARHLVGLDRLDRRGPRRRRDGRRPILGDLHVMACHPAHSAASPDVRALEERRVSPMRARTDA